MSENVNQSHEFQISQNDYKCNNYQASYQVWVYHENIIALNYSDQINDYYDKQADYYSYENDYYNNQTYWQNDS